MCQIVLKYIHPLQGNNPEQHNLDKCWPLAFMFDHAYRVSIIFFRTNLALIVDASCIKIIAATVFLMLFINDFDRCHTSGASSIWKEQFFQAITTFKLGFQRTRKILHTPWCTCSTGRLKTCFSLSHDTKALHISL